MKKLVQRLVGKGDKFQPMVSYNGLEVFGQPDQGAPTTGQGFLRALNELRMRPVEHLFEYCAGPGYIGFALLAQAFCRRLSLADSNPAAIEAARHTIEHNNLFDRAVAHVSDGLEQIPSHEKWNLVVARPPHMLPQSPANTGLRTYDPEWRLHRALYLNLKRFMKPEGHAVVMERRDASTVETFEEMIREGGGRVSATHLSTDGRGFTDGFYYIVTEW